MARGKYEAKRGTMSPPAVVSRGVGSPSTAGSAALPAPTSPAAAGRRADLPVLGIVVMSPWGWRILAVAAMVAVGLCITFLLDGRRKGANFVLSLPRKRSRATIYKGQATANGRAAVS